MQALRGTFSRIGPESAIAVGQPEVDFVELGSVAVEVEPFMIGDADNGFHFSMPN